jgi:hypothetical protein
MKGIEIFMDILGLDHTESFGRESTIYSGIMQSDARVCLKPK